MDEIARDLKVMLDIRINAVKVRVALVDVGLALRTLVTTFLGQLEAESNLLRQLSPDVSNEATFHSHSASSKLPKT